MGYEHKINRLLGDSDEEMLNAIIQVYQKDKKEYQRLDNEFNEGLLALTDYSRDEFIKLIEDGLYSEAWKKLSTERKNEILNEIEPILLKEKKFSEYLENFDSFKFVFLETETKTIVYCNGMYAPMSENDKKSNDNLRFALRAPYVTIRNNSELDKYAQENEEFPVWLNELTFLKPLLEDFWDSPKKTKMKLNV